MNRKIFKVSLDMPWLLLVAGFSFFVFLAPTPFASAQGNVRKALIALDSDSGNKLQCSCSVGADGTMHANNRQVNEEESWWLWSVGDSSQHHVALQNYRNGYFMWRHPGGNNNHRVRVIHDIGPESTWTMISGSDYGLPGDYVAFKAYDGAYLKAWNGGGHADAPGEGGEVYVDIGPPSNNIHWVGWWHMGQVVWTPQPGHDVWNTLGNGADTAIRWVGQAIEWVFSQPGPAQNVPPAPVPVISCSNPPAVVSNGTDRWVHAFCEGVVPTDYLGPFYPSDDPYVAQRVACDIAAHHKVAPTHNVVSVTCDASMRATADCVGMPVARHLHPQPPPPLHGQIP